jgi:valyl-tRNA synthetase
LPYVTEEVWSWWQDGSIHLSSWPAPHDGLEVDADPALLDAVAAALMGIRSAKSQAKVSMRAALARVEVSGPQALVDAAASAAEDLRRAGHVQGDLVFSASDGTEIAVSAELAEVAGA